MFPISKAKTFHPSRKRMNPALLITWLRHTSRLRSKAMKPIVFHTLCWRSKEICDHWSPATFGSRAPFAESRPSEREDKRAIAGRLQDYPQDNPPGTIHPIIHYRPIGGIDPGTNNDLNYHRVPVFSEDRHLGQWASPAPPRVPRGNLMTFH